MTSDAMIIGAGISGIHQLYRLPELGMKVRCRRLQPGLGASTRFLNAVARTSDSHT